MSLKEKLEWQKVFSYNRNFVLYEQTIEIVQLETVLNSGERLRVWWPFCFILQADDSVDVKDYTKEFN